jgi:hypothetical protein
MFVPALTRATTKVVSPFSAATMSFFSMPGVDPVLPRGGGWEGEDEAAGKDQANPSLHLKLHLKRLGELSVRALLHFLCRQVFRRP